MSVTGKIQHNKSHKLLSKYNQSKTADRVKSIDDLNREYIFTKTQSLAPTEIKEDYTRVSKDGNSYREGIRSFREIEQAKRTKKNVGASKRESLLSLNTTFQQHTKPDQYVNVNFKPHSDSIPDYLKISEQDKSKQPGRIYIMSRANGWLTVDSQTRDRKNAYENQSTKLINRETSPTSPQWM